MPARCMRSSRACPCNHISCVGHSHACESARCSRALDSSVRSPFGSPACGRARRAVVRGTMEPYAYITMAA
eukprot:11214647-Lingulodinium_polyedra.AAC.1